jgi:NAD(P)-dependent dehydrogenase (short-subunit alcohol dehydrogenase family)
MPHPALVPDAVAVVTGGASGIGLAAARRFAGAGLRVCIADLGAERLAAATAAVAAASPAGEGAVMALETDVARREDLAALEAAVAARWGGADVLMNNAGIGPDSGVLGPAEAWTRTLAVNLWGVIHGTQAFVPGMIARGRATGRAGLVVNTGSKQGITTPPGNPAYNVSKAGVKVFTEALAHELRETPGCRITAHLLIPGFVFTGLTRGGRTEKPPAAWTPEETVAFMLERIDAGDFYLLCPDNDVPRELDEKRIAWAAGDLIENRPALSRWHPDHAEAFAAFVKAR